MDKPYFWNSEKNELLNKDRGFGFEDIVEALDSGGLLDDIPHLNDQYSNQRIYVVNVEGYAVMVPYVEEDDYIFLKTAFYSRKANKKYFK